MTLYEGLDKGDECLEAIEGNEVMRKLFVATAAGVVMVLMVEASKRFASITVAENLFK